MCLSLLVKLLLVQLFGSYLPYDVQKRLLSPFVFAFLLKMYKKLFLTI